MARQRRKKGGGTQRRSQLYVEPQLPTWWDWVVIVLTVGTLAALFAEWWLALSGPVTVYLQWGDNVVCAVFIAEFAVRYRMAPRRLEFVRRNWIDLLGAVPTVDALRGMRLVRLVRVLRVMRFYLVWRRVARRYDIPFPKGVLTTLGLGTASIWMASAWGFYHYERDVNFGIRSFGDAAWWSMTTLSTVGYGDIYPTTSEGRTIAVLTMVLGIGLLGAVAATTASTFIELRDRGKKGLRSYVMRDHLLVLGWNEKAERAIASFRNDPRHTATDIVVVAELPEKPIDDPNVRFVRGAPGKLSVLRRASAPEAGAAIVLASAPDDARSDHESALVVTSLRRLNANIRVGVELVDADNAEHLSYAGADALIDHGTTIANLLVRAVQDVGVSDVVTELISAKLGSALYRVAIDEDWVGRPFRDYAVTMVEARSSVVGLARGNDNIVNPDPDEVIRKGDEAFVVAHEPPH